MVAVAPHDQCTRRQRELILRRNYILNGAAHSVQRSRAPDLRAATWRGSRGGQPLTLWWQRLLI